MKVIGCDFGASAKVGEQARKTVLLEAVRTADRTYRCPLKGRNAQLLSFFRRSSERTSNWKALRAGWTLDDLAQSLTDDSDVGVVAFDFPFSIPYTLLQSSTFAESVHQRRFKTRRAWVRFLHSALSLSVPTDRASETIAGLKTFDCWKTSLNWLKRATDQATSAQPPLKHLYQNVFNMTLLGSVLLHRLEKAGLATTLTPEDLKFHNRQSVETYPGLVARRIGVSGSYKQQPVECIQAGKRWLKSMNIKLAFPDQLKRACENYQSAPGDHDAADAFLCLVSAIAVAEGEAEMLTGSIPLKQQREEGGIVVPKVAAASA